MRNMKIKVENNLGEIVGFLKTKGYILNFQLTKNPTWITVNEFGSIGFFSFNPSDEIFKLISLNELKDVQNAK